MFFFRQSDPGIEWEAEKEVEALGNIEVVQDGEESEEADDDEDVDDDEPMMTNGKVVSVVVIVVRAWDYRALSSAT